MRPNFFGLSISKKEEAAPFFLIFAFLCPFPFTYSDCLVIYLFVISSRQLW